MKKESLSPSKKGFKQLQFWLKPEEKDIIDMVVFFLEGDSSKKKKWMMKYIHECLIMIKNNKHKTIYELLNEFNEYKISVGEKTISMDADKIVSNFEDE